MGFEPMTSVILVHRLLSYVISQVFTGKLFLFITKLTVHVAPGN